MNFVFDGQEYLIRTGLIGAAGKGPLQPWFKVFRASQTGLMAVPLHHRDTDGWDETFATQAEAMTAAAKAARAWIEANGNKVRNG